MLNFYYDLDFGYRLIPYLAGGIGAALNNLDAKVSDIIGDLETSERETSFAWNVKAGIRFKFTKSAILDVFYQHANLGNIDIPLLETIEGANALESDSFTANTAFIKLTWEFVQQEDDY